MGSLDMSGAKRQFFELVDTISTSHLPSFTLWLDAKLAEYKTIGQLKPDTDYESREQYPEWIGKALRQNLSFLFPGNTQTLSSSASNGIQNGTASIRKRRQSSDSSSVERRRKMTCKGRNLNEAPAAEEELVVVKEEPGGSAAYDKHLSRDTSLPGHESTLPRAAEGKTNFASRQAAAPISFSTASDTHMTSSATLTSAPPPPSNSVPRFVFSINSQKNSSTDALKSDSTSVEEDSVPLFSRPAVSTKLEASPTPVLGGGLPACSEPLPLSPPPLVGQLLIEARRPAQTFPQEAVQDAIRKYHGGKATYALTIEDIQSLKNDQGHIVCPLCRKWNVRLGNYLKHFVSHTREQPFKCPYCCKCFGDNSNCYAHQSLHHHDQPKVKVFPTV